MRFSSTCARGARLLAISRGRDRAFSIDNTSVLSVNVQEATANEQMHKLAAFGSSNREFRRSLCSEHAHSGRCERDAFQTPTAGKNVPAPENKNGPHPGANPESRMNDNPAPQDRVGAPNTAPK
jgi:hypothetical protein